MWTLEEIENRNSDLPRRVRTLLNTGAADEEMLCDGADLLDDLSQSHHVLAYAKLPFPIHVKPGQRFAIAVRTGHSISLQFSHFRVTCTDENTLAFSKLEATLGQTAVGVGSQVRGVIRMWGQHSYYFDNYLSCMSNSGLISTNLNPELFGQRRAPVGWAGTLVHSEEFEQRLLVAATAALKFGLMRFLEAYSIAYFDGSVLPPSLPSSFVMTAPGRVRYVEPLTSPAPLMLRRDYFGKHASPRRIEKGLQYSRRSFDRYIKHLISMRELAASGEPALAIVGAITCIEWFLRQLLVNPVSVDDDHPPGIRECLRSPLKIALPGRLRERLLQTLVDRNNATHGDPLFAQEEPSKKEEFSAVLGTILDLGLDLYREAQSQLTIGLID